MSNKNKKSKSKPNYQDKENLEMGTRKKSFYTSSARQKLKEELEQNINDIDDYEL